MFVVFGLSLSISTPVPETNCHEHTLTGRRAQPWLRYADRWTTPRHGKGEATAGHDRRLPKLVRRRRRRQWVRESRGETGKWPMDFGKEGSPCGHRSSGLTRPMNVISMFISPQQQSRHLLHKFPSLLWHPNQKRNVPYFLKKKNRNDPHNFHFCKRNLNAEMPSSSHVCDFLHIFVLCGRSPKSSSLSFQLGLAQIAAPGHASCVYFIFICCLNFEFLACWLVNVKSATSTQ